MEPDPERIDAIRNAVRSQRTRPSRTLWIVALVIGGACALGFGAIWLVPTAASSTEPAITHHDDHTFGFLIGVVFGVVVGIAIGIAIARQRADRHSERNSP